MQQFLKILEIATSGQGMVDVTWQIADVLACREAQDGVLTVFLQHTSASLTIQENADPDVQTDLLGALDRLAPQDAPYEHSVEGPDDMPAHIRTMVTGVSLSIPVSAGRMTLGTWQGIYLVEHRTRPHRRSVVLQFTGTMADRP